MKNKGFTLVELLVVIVIIGVIAGISIPLIRNISSTFDKKKYKTFSDSMVSAAKLYNDSYSEDLFGHNENGCAYVTYQQLVDKNLLKDIDLDKVSCNSSSTFVRVLKAGDRYSYIAFLGCGNKKNGKVEKISYTLPVEGKESNEMNPGYCTGVMENNLLISATPEKSIGYSKKQASTQLKIESATGINTSIELQTKWITKAEKDAGNYASMSGFTRTGFKVKGNQEDKILKGEIISTTSGNLTTPAGVSGEYYLLVRVDKLTDLYGDSWKNPDNTNNKFLVYGPFEVDNQPPTVPTIVAYVKKDENDITSPSGLGTIASKKWSNAWLLTIPNSTDNVSGTINYYYTTGGKTSNATDVLRNYRNINAEGISTVKFKACDNAGNCSAYSGEFVAKLDRTRPTCSGEGASTKWTNSDRTLSNLCTDKLSGEESQASGCNVSSQSKTYNYSIKTDTITIKDNVGNSRNCTYDIYVDKDKPSKPSINNPSGGKWVNKNFSLKLESTDNMSGISYYQYTYNAAATKTGTNSSSDWVTYSRSNTTSFTTTNFSAERSQLVYVRSCDGAGNCSNKNSTYIKLDKTAPKVEAQCTCYLPVSDLNNLTFFGKQLSDYTAAGVQTHGEFIHNDWKSKKATYGVITIAQDTGSGVTSRKFLNRNNNDIKDDTYTNANGNGRTNWMDQAGAGAAMKITISNVCDAAGNCANTFTRDCPSTPVCYVGWYLVGGKKCSGSRTDYACLRKQQWAYRDKDGRQLKNEYAYLNPTNTASSIKYNYYFTGTYSHIGWRENANHKYEYYRVSDWDENGSVEGMRLENGKFKISGKVYTFDANGICTNCKSKPSGDIYEGAA